MRNSQILRTTDWSKRLIMKHIGLVLGLLVFVNGANAQSTDTKQALPSKTAPKPTPSTNADLEIKERRSRARSLLVSLSTDARTFRDQTLRARSLARIADALSQIDSEQARLLFRKAWEAAEVADQESDALIAVANALNERGLPSARGGKWTARAVINARARLAK